MKPRVQHEIKGLRQFHISWELIEEEKCFMSLRLGFLCLKYNMPKVDMLWANRRPVWLLSATSFLPFLLFLLLQTQELPIQLRTFLLPFSNQHFVFFCSKVSHLQHQDIWGQIVFVVRLSGHCKIFSGIAGLHPPNPSITSNLPPYSDRTPKTSPDVSDFPLQAKLSLVANLCSTAWWSHCTTFSF